MKTFNKLNVKNEFYNLSISKNYSKDKFMLMPSDFYGAFAYWATIQGMDGRHLLDKALKAFRNMIDAHFTNPKIPEWWTYKRLEDVINENTLENIQDIKELNEGKNFIDLSVLSRNIFYMIIREQITQPL